MEFAYGLPYFPIAFRLKGDCTFHALFEISSNFRVPTNRESSVTMKSSSTARYFLILFAFVSIALGLFRGSAAAIEIDVPKGFTSLFNGRDLTGWKGLAANPKERAEMSTEQLAAAQKEADKRMRSHWKVVDGVLIFDGKDDNNGDNLCTQQDYGDFELYVDWKIPVGGDSGIYLRGHPQVQIWDTEYEPIWRHGADKGSGAFWNNKQNPRFPLVKADKPVGQWNTFFIRMLGERATVKLNGKLVVDNVVVESIWAREKPIHATGTIELQNHGNTLSFRNIFVREIPSAEANALLSARDADNFETIFNGRDFTGWTGDTESYEVKDGTLQCKPGKSGTMFTKKEYADFVVRLEFKLPPGGNNGLVIRYPGSGLPSVAGMCELQVLDSEHSMYATLDSRQYHGSIYGMVPAHRGYLRPTGQWNFQQTTVKGSTIQVELNGFTILDADVSPITEFLDDKLHPGKDLRSGHFGFVGHNDPVEFRNISIRELSEH